MWYGGLILVLDDINPQPWTPGTRSRGGMVKDQQLVAYQNAIKEEAQQQLAELNTEVPTGLEYKLEFLFWRLLDQKNYGTGRKARANIADATNLQKATEDALQGVLFDNDRHIRDVRSVIIAQSENTSPRVIVKLHVFDPLEWNLDNIHMM